MPPRMPDYNRQNVSATQPCKETLADTRYAEPENSAAKKGCAGKRREPTLDHVDGNAVTASTRGGTPKLPGTTGPRPFRN